MQRKLFLFIMGLFLFVPLFAQNDFSGFTSLKSAGKIPADFKKYLTSENKEDILLKRLFSSGLILYGSELNQYVDKVADQVLKDHPDLRKEMRFYILRSSAVNAFAFSDHVILINLGLLAQIQNESELAFIISHELIHIVNKHIEKEKVEKKKKKKTDSLFNQLKNRTEVFDGVNYIELNLPVSPNIIKDIAYRFKNHFNDNNFVFIAGSVFDSKPTLIIMLSQDLVQKGKNAGSIVREASKLIQGSGGGQPFFATAGGKDTEAIQEAILKAKELIFA